MKITSIPKLKTVNFLGHTFHNVPDWVKWVTVDKHGWVIGHEKRPARAGFEWISCGKKHKLADAHLDRDDDWHEMIEELKEPSHG